MTSAIEQSFAKARRSGRCAFIPFLTGGFPDLDTCEKLIIALDQNGADVIEIGVPFSDPLADGPTIQDSSHKALRNGTTPVELLDLAARLSPGLSCPLVLMTYVNPVMKAGLKEFALKAKEAGVAGIIIPDLPLEEADEWIDAARACNLDTIFLVAPTTPLERVKSVAAASRGFLYYVSTTGVTGGTTAISEETSIHMDQSRAISQVPVAVGFGIASPEQAQALAGKVDGIIVGSALVRKIQEHSNAAEQVRAVSEFAASLSAALNRPAGNNGSGVPLNHGEHH